MLIKSEPLSAIGGEPASIASPPLHSWIKPALLIAEIDATQAGFRIPAQDGAMIGSS
ncbi:MAG: hypothetical protein LC667_15610 [Thioalkalivibrio sp.]|nr:hypothetical protein [Thioalkalivibrio sp.]